MGRTNLPIALAIVLVTAGCALQFTHESKVAAPLAAARQGNIDEALRAPDSKTQPCATTGLSYNPPFNTHVRALAMPIRIRYG